MIQKSKQKLKRIFSKFFPKIISDIKYTKKYLIRIALRWWLEVTCLQHLSPISMERFVRYFWKMVVTYKVWNEPESLTQSLKTSNKAQIEWALIEWFLTQ